MARISALVRRKQLVDAAFRVIRNEGFQAATTRRVCAEAGASLAAFHYCFSSKEEMLVELTEQTVAELVGAQVDAVEIRGTAAESLQASLRFYWSTVEAEPGREAVLMALTQQSLNDPALAGIAEKQYEAYRRVAMETLVQIADGCNVTWTLPMDQLARMIIVVTDGVTLGWLVDKDGEAAVAALDAFALGLAGYAVARD
ncbi:TetR/AcrR family transcriptional regulator [Pseudonocardia sp. GCM10023141]|uniref:TetR/AcrR family transcriptional regulator n=1 Tax=Pseudonocardia sp. GCM10023141 TaxID=3252653 RepID=UPI003616FBCD